MKLRNIGVIVVEGQLQGVFTDKSKWSSWSLEPVLEATAVQRHQRNVVAGPGPGRRHALFRAVPACPKLAFLTVRVSASGSTRGLHRLLCVNIGDVQLVCAP